MACHMLRYACRGNARATTGIAVGHGQVTHGLQAGPRPTARWSIRGCSIIASNAGRAQHRHLSGVTRARAR
jgi:hypothetical protein